MKRVLLKNIDTPNNRDLDVYISSGGYNALKKAYSMSPVEVTDEVIMSGLGGRGGAWYPTGKKWKASRETGRTPKYLIANADEGEPGTFKDRVFLEKDPHMLIEGMLIAAYAIGAKSGYIYIRGEYPEGANVLEAAIRQAEERGYLGSNILGSGNDFYLKVYRGAGAYVCGEDSALIESIEGNRGHCRLKPPYPAAEGLFSMPTVVNNVETLVNVPHIIERGAEWFASIGSPKYPGPKIFCLSGNVKRPGLYELPTGITLRTLIYTHGGGITAGKKLKAVIPGGLATSLLTQEHLDVRMDMDGLIAAGSSIGSGAVIVMDEDVCMVHAAKRAAKFFARESCGKCTPCREGTRRMREILERITDGKGRESDLDLMKELGEAVQETALCGLGGSCANFILSTLKYFRHEYLTHIHGTACPEKAA
ncbi:MAG: NADH-quinone oxidoreductase subunit NuoF [Nitrospiraceae bacterium]|nr:NADH-quinone oxidoreductase subunit NuoF [Nitrospiraceae bacterium]